MREERVTKNFKAKEFFKSNTSETKGIDNIPSDGESLDVYLSIAALANNCLQPIRNKFPQNSIIISSGFRNEQVNKLVGGSKSSDHRFGAAADFTFSGSINYRIVFDWIKDNLDFDQLIWEHGNERTPQWVHISYRKDGNNRKQVLRAYKVGKETKYKPYE